MKEQTFQAGAQRQLTGVLSLPDKLDPARPALIIPNTGLDPRSGPNRMHVEAGRALASNGYACLRLDIAGLGDSDPLPGTRPDSVQDLKAAMDEMQKRGLASRFVLAGLCSGAHDAHQTALVDERVAGAVFLDGYAYRTPKFRWHWLLQRVFEPRRLRAGLRRLTFSSAPPPDPVNLFAQPSLQQARADYARMLERGLALAFVYTGQVQNEFNYEDQLWDMFPVLRGHPKLLYRYMIHADHIFSRRAQRVELLGLLLPWLQKHF